MPFFLFFLRKEVTSPQEIIGGSNGVQGRTFFENAIKKFPVWLISINYGKIPIVHKVLDQVKGHMIFFPKKLLCSIMIKIRKLSYAQW